MNRSEDKLQSTLEEISQLLDTGLDPKSLSICRQLIELDVHPDTLADIIKELNYKARRNRADDKRGYA